MTFTTPCFVRVENPEKRKELIEWLEGIGYHVCSCCEFKGWNTLTCGPVERLKTTYEVHGVPDYDKETGANIGQFKVENALKNNPAIDCDDDIDCFKALAAMNDENDRDQWFTNGSDWGIFRSTPPPKGYEHWGDTEGMEFFCLPNSLDVENYRKATAEEIVEYFKNNK